MSSNTSSIDPLSDDTARNIVSVCRGAPDPDPVGSKVGSGKYWPDLHNYDVKHHSILSFHHLTHDNTELYENSITQSFQFNTVNVSH